jgi:hypothetical protein
LTIDDRGPRRLATTGRPVATGPAVVRPGTLDDLGTMPELLVGLLERRYLGEFEPSRWVTSNAVEDGTCPLLREIVGLGREGPDDNWAAAMPHVLGATHESGQAFITVVHGDGERHRLHVGGRRLTRRLQGSTEDYLEGQAGILAAHLPGLVLSPATRLDGPVYAELAELLRSAPSLAAVTGVPSPRQRPEAAAFQRLDRLVAAAGRRRYAVVVIAEPLDQLELDRTVDRCRGLLSEIHGLVRRTVSRSSAEAETDSTSTPDQSTSPAEWALPTGLAALAAFCGLAGLMPAIAPIAGLAGPAMLAASASRQMGQVRKATSTTGRTTSTTDGASSELLDAQAQACEVLLTRHLARLEAARSSGWWRTSVFLAAESDGALEAVGGALRGLASGDSTSLDPVRLVRLSPHRLRAAMTQGLPVGLLPASDSETGHPFGAPFDAVATPMTSEELAVLVTPPRDDIPGLPRQSHGRFALTAPPPAERSIELGRLIDHTGGRLGPVHLSAEALNRHTLVTGMTGYGKSTTAQRLLVEGYRELGVPFLVIEPVKGEYRRLAEHPALRGRVRVYTVGREAYGLPLRLNPFAPVAGVPLLRHLDLLKAVFNAAFPMGAGMSYVLEEAMLELYQDRGWDLHTSRNLHLPSRPSAGDEAALVPSVADLHAKIDEVLERKHYGREIHQNLGAALRSRLGNLMVGTKGVTLNSARGVPARDLFTEPSVIELRNLGDDEEKAFVMALLLCQLYEFAESRQGEDRHDEQLQHLTLIEEAHRLLRAPRGPGSAESADSQAKAVTMFTDMFAELRALGEGFVVAEQIPTKLAPEILKNSSVKIVHRIVAPDDRAVLAGSINLDPAQSRHLGALRPGVAVVHDDRMESAVLTALTPPSRGAGGLHVQTAEPSSVRYLQRFAACRHCPAPCTVAESSERAMPDPVVDEHLGPLFRAVLADDLHAARSAWTSWCETCGADPTTFHCWTARAAHRWVRGVIEARGAATTTPDALLRHARASRALADLLAAWTSEDTNDAEDTGHPSAAVDAGAAEPRTAFDTAHGRLAEQLADAPPRERPGCSGCRVRCRMLPVAGPLVATIGTTVSARATASSPAQTRVRNLERIQDGSFTDAFAALPGEAARRDFLACLVTLSTEDADTPGDVLDELRRDL